jgi:hypothetical protein
MTELVKKGIHTSPSLHDFTFALPVATGGSLIPFPCHHSVMDDSFIVSSSSYVYTLFASILLVYHAFGRTL